MDAFAPTRKTVRAIRDTLGPYLETFLVMLSAVAVTLFVFNQFVPKDANISFFGWTWVQFQRSAHTAIWAAFLAVYLVYGATSHRRPIGYAKKWWMESLICITWLPFTNWALVEHMHTILSLQGWMLIGITAHMLRIGRWTRNHFSEHAIILIGVMTGAMVLIATAMLMVVEPQTYRSFDETAFSVYMAATTMGPSAWPVTAPGRIVFFFIATGGVTTVALFAGVIREFVQRLFGHKDVSMQLLHLLQATHGMMQKLTSGTHQALLDQVTAQQTQIELQQRQIELQQLQIESQQVTIGALQALVGDKGAARESD